MNISIKNIFALSLMAAAIPSCKTANSASDTAAATSDKNVVAAPAATPSLCTKRNSIGMVFCDIPAGSFVLGSPATEVGRNDNERSREEKVAAFEMLATEVTQAMWQQVMGPGSNPSFFRDDPTRPAERVTWREASQLVETLNKKLASERYVYSLPTEVQWEYAARGGKTGPYGIDGAPAEFAWTSENSGDKPHPVGQLKANAYGLFDMHGNVWEWTADADNSENKGNYVIRGGSWANDAVDARSARRLLAFLGHKIDNQGVRLIRTLPKKP